jgi:predicted nucleic acid-binding protein
VIPSPVLVEIDYMASRELGPGDFSAVLDQIKNGAFEIADLVEADYDRIAELLRTYADLRVGFVDAAVLAIVERLREPKLATLDHRHFLVMRPRHVEALELLPA